MPSIWDIDVVFCAGLWQKSTIHVIVLHRSVAAGKHSISQQISERLVLSLLHKHLVVGVALQRLNNCSRQVFGKLADVALSQQLKPTGGFDFPVFVSQNR